MALADGLHDVPADRIAAVVTSLEMKSRPALRPEMPGPWHLRRLNRPEPEAYRALYSKIGDEWIWFSRLLMSDAELTAILWHPRIEIYGLDVAGKLEGLLELDYRIEGEAELAFFGVTAPLIGSGAARWLMNRALEQVWQRPISRFWVHTCTLDHPNALAFYMRSGFVPFRRQIEIAPDPRLQGVSLASRARTPVLVTPSSGGKHGL
ncbi:MAG: GNAT family N-acetyltransferase [Proteobacteria bacterium]|nr:GNAT family N-acetyltransferase [Pseudomonadota bacterium]